MNFSLSWATAADQVAELVGLTAEIVEKQVTGQPRDPELEQRFADAFARAVHNVQKGVMK